MNYERIYNQIIERAKNEVEQRIEHKKNDGYYEGHHIIPRCMGGQGRSASWANSDAAMRHHNIIGLTAREHFICHWLLIRIYPSNRRLAHAFWIMCNKPSSNISQSSRVYAECRELISKLPVSIETREKHRNFKHSETTKKHLSTIQKGHTVNDVTKRKISNKKRNVPLSDKHKQNISNGLTGHKRSDITRKKMAIAQRNLNKKLSIETIEKIRLYNIGRKHTEETKRKISINTTLRNKEIPIVTCTYCSKTGKLYPNMVRWHLDNCNQKPGNQGIRTIKQITCTYCNKTGGVNNMYRYHMENCKYKKE